MALCAQCPDTPPLHPCAVARRTLLNQSPPSPTRWPPRNSSRRHRGRSCAWRNVPNIAAVRSVRRDVETGLQTGLETVVKYIQTVQTIKLKILIKYTLSRSLYGLYVIHSSLYPGLYTGLYPVSTSETIGAGQHRMFSRRSSKPRHFARRSGSRTWRSSWIGAAVVSSTTWSSRRPSSAWACLPASERQWALRRGRLSPANRLFHAE